MDNKKQDGSDTNRFRVSKAEGPSKSTIKEVRMNIKKIHEGIKQLQEDIGDALIATDLWTVSDAVSLAAFNPQPKAVALFNRITDNINKALRGSNFPAINKYYLLDLENDNVVLVLPLGDFQWGLLIDGKKTQLGMILNVALPHILEAFNQAIKE